MSDPIRVGDLVRVERWPHEHHREQQLGRFFVVSSFTDRCQCRACGLPFEGVIAWTPSVCACPVEWLKKIPPLSELEGKRQKEDIPMYDITRPDTVERLTREWAKRVAKEEIDRLKERA